MDIGKYGPFASVVAIAVFLIVSFGTLLFKMVGSTQRWAWYAGGTPSFLVVLPARMIAIALMAITFITISEENFYWFGGIAIGFSFLGVYYINRFNRQRLLYVVPIPSVGPNGNQLIVSGRPAYHNVIVGPESKMNRQAKGHYSSALKNNPGLTVTGFMSGYGTPPNDPQAIWSKDLLAELTHSLTLSISYFFLCAVMVLYLSAFIIDVYSRTF